MDSKHTESRAGRACGFPLVELTIALAVVGVVIAMALR